MQENIEIWKDVVGYEGYYQVSNLGRVKSVDRIVIIKKNFCEFEKLRKSKLLKPIKSNTGYMRVGLHKNGIYIKKSVHRLVCESFIENKNNHPIINHKDENKENNNVNNLEWCTYSYNRNYGTATKKIKDIETNSPKKSKKVAQIKNGEIIAIFPSVAEVQRSMGYMHSNIISCCNNKPHHNTAYGYEWKYL